MCFYNSRTNKLCRLLKKRHGWTEEVLNQSWEGYLNSAIKLLLEALRQWNLEKYPRIDYQVVSIVDSLVSHDYAAAKKQAESVKWVPLEEAYYAVAAEEPYVDSNQGLRQEIFERIGAGKDSDKLCKIVEHKLENEPRFNPDSGKYLWEPSEIAKELGWDVKEVYRLKKILRRRLEGFQKEYAIA